MKLIYNISLFALAAMTMAACSSKTTKTDKEMNTLSFTAEQAAEMTLVACHEARGDQSSLSESINRSLDAGLTVNQMKEALAHLYAYTGFPRSLNALGTLQKVLEQRQNEGKTTEEGVEASPLPSNYNALAQGTEVQTKLSGQPFNYAFCPAEDYYLKAHLFGDIFARDNLTYADRELVTVSALSGLVGVEPQLKAHIAGARNMGVTEEQLQGIVVALAANSLLQEAGRLAKAYNELSTSNSPTSPTLHGSADRESEANKELSTLNSPWPQGSPNTAYAQFFIGNNQLCIRLCYAPKPAMYSQQCGFFRPSEYNIHDTGNGYSVHYIRCRRPFLRRNYV